MKKFLALIAVAAIAGTAYYAGTQQPTNDQTDDDRDPRIAAAAEMLVGMWSSEDDRNLIRTYKDDGTAEDNLASAEGETITTAEWSLYTADTAPADVDFQLNGQDVYVRHTLQDGSALDFRIISLTPDEMGLMDMEAAVATRFGKMTTGNEMQDGQEDEGLGQGVSFNCQDGSHFIAEYPTMGVMTVIVDGVDAGTLTMVSAGNGNRYENEEWIFVFKGEGVTKQKKGSTDVTTCTQPFDANLAPVNYGE